MPEGKKEEEEEEEKSWNDKMAGNMTTRSKTLAGIENQVDGPTEDTPQQKTRF